MDTESNKWANIAVAIVLVVVAVIALIVAIVGMVRVSDYKKLTDGTDAYSPEGWAAAGTNGEDSPKTRANGVFTALVVSTIASLLAASAIAFIVFSLFGVGALGVYVAAMFIVVVTWFIIMHYFTTVGEQDENAADILVQRSLFSIVGGVFAVQLIHAIGAVVLAAYFVLAPRFKNGKYAALDEKSDSLSGGARSAARQSYWTSAPAAASTAAAMTRRGGW